MLAQTSIIARNTFTESIRQPVFVIVTLLGTVLPVFAAASSALTLDDDNKLLIDMVLMSMYMLGTITAALVASSVLSREINNKTVLTVISKPIARPAFIVGKFIGVTAAVGVAYWVWLIVSLMCVRHGVMSTAADKHDMVVITLSVVAFLIAGAIAVWGNYFYNWVFASRFSVLLAVTLTLAYLIVLVVNRKWELQPIAHEFTEEEGRLVQVLIAAALVFEALIVTCAVAIAGSTRLGWVGTLLLCGGVFFLGINTERWFLAHTSSQPWAWLGFAVAPNGQFFYMADALTQKSPITLAYFTLVTGYAACYVMGLLCLAVALFQTRETG
jgi:hypothetical protein